MRKPVLASFPCTPVILLIVLLLLPLTSCTATPVPTPTPTVSRYAGVRASSYGIDPFPSATGWANAIDTMANYWPGSTPATIWLVGEILFVNPNKCGLQFSNPTPGTSYTNITFENVGINHDTYLSYFDTAGIKVFLSVEPGDADVSTLIALIMNKYSGHPCVAGMGIDVEWNQYSQNHEGVRVTDAQAQAWETQVKSYNSNYKLFLKHWDSSKMPPSYRGSIIFIDDSENLGSLNALVSEFRAWGNAFPNNPVFFQFGYESDQSWWSQLADPPKTIGDDLIAAVPRSNLFWVDFTLRGVLPTE